MTRSSVASDQRSPQRHSRSKSLHDSRPDQRYIRASENCLYRQTISTVYLNDVPFDSLHKLPKPEIAMIQWQAPMTPEAIDVPRAPSKRIPATLPRTVAQDNNLDGTGVVVAVIGTGVSDTANSGSNGFVQLTGTCRGYDATNPNDPGTHDRSAGCVHLSRKL